MWLREGQLLLHEISTAWTKLASEQVRNRLVITDLVSWGIKKWFGKNLIRKLSMGELVAGTYRNAATAAYWDGNNQHGEPIASGIYFYQIRTSQHQEMRKMVILK